MTMYDDVARDVVKELLLQTHSRINFTISGIDINPNRLVAVGQAIEDRRIFVEYNDSAVNFAIYNPGQNKFIVSCLSSVTGSVAANVDYAALIIHEAVHAMCDLFNTHWVQIQTSEAAGYIAQFIYLQTHGVIVPSTVPPEFTAIQSEASTVAAILLSGATPTWGQYEAVRTAVLNVPRYQARAGQSVGFNGVPQSVNPLYPP